VLLVLFVLSSAAASKLLLELFLYGGMLACKSQHYSGGNPTIILANKLFNGPSTRTIIVKRGQFNTGICTTIATTPEDVGA